MQMAVSAVLGKVIPSVMNNLLEDIVQQLVCWQSAPLRAAPRRVVASDTVRYAVASGVLLSIGTCKAAAGPVLHFPVDRVP